MDQLKSFRKLKFLDKVKCSDPFQPTLLPIEGFICGFVNQSGYGITQYFSDDTLALLVSETIQEANLGSYRWKAMAGAEVRKVPSFKFKKNSELDVIVRIIRETA